MVGWVPFMSTSCKIGGTVITSEVNSHFRMSISQRGKQSFSCRCFSHEKSYFILYSIFLWICLAWLNYIGVDDIYCYCNVCIQCMLFNECSLNVNSSWLYLYKWKDKQRNNDHNLRLIHVRFRQEHEASWCPWALRLTEQQWPYKKINSKHQSLLIMAPCCS